MDTKENVDQLDWTLDVKSTFLIFCLELLATIKKYSSSFPTGEDFRSFSLSIKNTGPWHVRLEI